MLDSKLHPINIKTNNNTKTDALLHFLTSIRTYVDTQEAPKLRQRRSEAFEPLEHTVLTKSISTQKVLHF